MNPRFSLQKITAFIGFTLLIAASNVHALMINWTDWESSNSDNGFTAFGTITSGTETIDVTYNNPLGVSFIQTGNGTDYFQNARNGRDPLTSAFTSEGEYGVDNIPPAAEMIALRFAGPQTLTFSQAIANPYFAYVSLNSNGYGFDQDFELLSNTGSNLDGSINGPDDNGYWGCGTSEKIDQGGGVFELNQANPTCGSEPHGVLRFTGTFTQVSWNSLSNENWNGFTLGVQGTATQVFPCQVDPGLPECQTNPVPAPATVVLFGIGLVGLGWSRRKQYSRS